MGRYFSTTQTLAKQYNTILTRHIVFDGHEHELHKDTELLGHRATVDCLLCIWYMDTLLSPYDVLWQNTSATSTGPDHQKINLVKRT